MQAKGEERKVAGEVFVCVVGKQVKTTTTAPYLFGLLQPSAIIAL